jgi:hypothetical protein
MTTQELLSAASQAGLILTPKGDRLHVAPAARLCLELREALTIRKRDLLAVLVRLEGMRRHGVDLTPNRAHPARPPLPVARRDARGGPGRCFSCGDAISHLEAYGRCTPCDIAAELFYRECPDAADRWTPAAAEPNATRRSGAR